MGVVFPAHRIPTPSFVKRRWHLFICADNVARRRRALFTGTGIAYQRRVCLPALASYSDAELCLPASVSHSNAGSVNQRWHRDSDTARSRRVQYAMLPTPISSSRRTNRPISNWANQGEIHSSGYSFLVFCFVENRGQYCVRLSGDSWVAELTSRARTRLQYVF